MDVDVAVAMDKANFTKFLDVMEKLGLKSRVAIDPKSLLDEKILRTIFVEKQALVIFFP